MSDQCPVEGCEKLLGDHQDWHTWHVDDKGRLFTIAKRFDNSKKKITVIDVLKGVHRK